MEIGGKKVLVIGGHELSVLQKAEIRRVCENACLEFQNVVYAIDRLAVVSTDATTSVKELIELASSTVYTPYLPCRRKVSRTTKEQHKRAMRYHGRR